MPKYSFWVLKYYFDFFQPLKNYKNPILVLRQYKNRWWAEFDLWGTVCQHLLWPKSHYQYLLYTRQRTCLAFPSLYPKLPLTAPQTVLLTFTSMPLKFCCIILLLLYFFNFSSAMFQQILAVQRGFLGYTILIYHFENVWWTSVSLILRSTHITPHVIITKYVAVAVVVEALSRLCLSVTPWTVAPQAHLSVGFPRPRILVWVAISFSRGSSQSQDQTHISCVRRWTLHHWPLGSPHNMLLLLY